MIQLFFKPKKFRFLENSTFLNANDYIEYNNFLLIIYLLLLVNKTKYIESQLINSLSTEDILRELITIKGPLRTHYTLAEGIIIFHEVCNALKEACQTP